jgi:hypothetical protein
MDTTTHRSARTTRRLPTRFVATCADCGVPIRADQTMCSLCANN